MERLIFLLIVLFMFSCYDDTDETFVETQIIQTEKEVYQKGVATWYGPGFDGRRTSSGQAYDMYAFTAAHRDLPLGSIVRVTNTKNNRSTVVLVNDRGPVNTNLILDLSKIAANNLDIVRKGSGKVEIEVLATSENPLEKIFDVYRNIGNSGREE